MLRCLIFRDKNGFKLEKEKNQKENKFPRRAGRIVYLNFSYKSHVDPLFKVAPYWLIILLARLGLHLSGNFALFCGIFQLPRL